MAELRRKPLTLSGWGRFPSADALAFRPERRSDLPACLTSVEGSVIARGAGRSYGDQALNEGGTTILTERLDRMISFDPDTGRLVTEPGLTFATLLEVFLPRGWLTPVSPGTSYATLGGAIANDVHGKNHDRMGSFGDHVVWFELLLPSGEIKRVSEHEEPGLFRATIGGSGLTGIITTLAVDLMRVPSNAVDLTERRVADLDQFIALLAEARNTATYSVGWIDALAKGRDLGRGILETAELSTTALTAKPRRERGVPINFPSFALNSLSVRAFNQLYYARVPAAGRQRHTGIAEFLYPLDAIANWNRIYGKPGFSQFQCVLPDATAPVGLRKMLEAVSAAGAASFLAVLKTLGRPGRGMLSFAMPGFTLALDFPRRRGTGVLLTELERLTLEAGGRIYLAKDSALSPEGMAAMYSDLPAFRMMLAEIDPDRRLDSDLARRLRLRS